MSFGSKKGSSSKGRRPVTKKDAEYDNTNRGVLFENDQKKSKNHPDYKGSFTDQDGREYWLSGWERTSKDGLDYMSIAATPKEVQEDQEEVEQEVPRKNRRGK